MIIKAYPSGPFSTNAYIVACSRTREAIIFDPAPGSFHSIDTDLVDHSLIPIAIVLTHSHWDHIADVTLFKNKYPIPVMIHPLDAANLEKPGSDRLPCWIHIEGVKPDRLLKEGEHISLGDLSFEVIHTPGHTPGGICLYCQTEKVLISGDTLFKESIGNLSFPTAQPDLMWPSLDKLAKLPPSTRVFPGHGPSTTIEAESWLPKAKELFNY